MTMYVIPQLHQHLGRYAFQTHNWNAVSAGLNGQSQRATELCVKDTTKPYYGKDRPGYMC